MDSCVGFQGGWGHWKFSSFHLRSSGVERVSKGNKIEKTDCKNGGMGEKVRSQQQDTGRIGREGHGIGNRGREQDISHFFRTSPTSLFFLRGFFERGRGTGG